jgi:hypothetical protein
MAKRQGNGTKKGEVAMIYVVEIQSHSGAKARKEYDAPTINAAWLAVERDLAHYPKFRIADIWIKDEPGTHPEVW